jgi:hypothetical protein
VIALIAIAPAVCAVATAGHAAVIKAIDRAAQTLRRTATARSRWRAITRHRIRSIGLTCTSPVSFCRVGTAIRVCSACRFCSNNLDKAIGRRPSESTEVGMGLSKCERPFLIRRVDSCLARSRNRAKIRNDFIDIFVIRGPAGRLRCITSRRPFDETGCGPAPAGDCVCRGPNGWRHLCGGFPRLRIPDERNLRALPNRRASHGGPNRAFVSTPVFLNLP